MCLMICIVVRFSFKDNCNVTTHCKKILRSKLASYSSVYITSKDSINYTNIETELFLIKYVSIMLTE